MIRVMEGDCRSVLATLPAQSVQCCVTSPPYYGLRDYGVDGQIGLEKTPDEYVAEMVAVFREVRRVLRDDGVLWLNLGDSYAQSGTKTTGRNDGDANYRARTSGNAHLQHDYASNQHRTAIKVNYGVKPKDLIGIPWMVAFALRADGWYLRSEVIWAKPNPMPESVTDRPTKAHEQVFLLSKSARYFYDADAIREDSVDPEGSAKRYAAPFFAGPKHESGNYSADGGKHTAGMKVFDGSRNARTIWTIATQPFSGTTKTVRQVRVAWDALDDGKKRITSPSCPIHGDRAGLAATPPGDAPADDHQNRNGSTATRRVQSQPSGSAPIGQIFEQETVVCNLGSQRLACSPVANFHSSPTNRTAPAPETTSPYKPCDQTHIGTERTSEVCGSSEPCGYIHASNTGSDETACSANHQTSIGSGDTQHEPAISLASDPLTCTCEYYIERTEKTSHFATMPPDLAERCIKAGSSEKGCCPHCGAPWVRMVERGPTVGQRSAPGQPAHITPQGYLRSGGSRCGDTATETVGWSATCDCPPHEPIPCTILDPFGGAGTTALVADRLNRNATIIELNPEYAALARERVTADAGMFAHVA